MSRFLFVVPPLTGHVTPPAGVAAELARRGHRVAWCGTADPVHPLTEAAAPVHDGAPADAGPVVGPSSPAGPAPTLPCADHLVRLADATVPQVERAVRDFAPDAVLVDRQAVAGALVCERLGVPYLTSVTTSAEPAAAPSPYSPYGILAFTGRELLGDAPLPWERVHLVGPVIAEGPEDPDFPWDDLDPGRALVFVSAAGDGTGRRFLDDAARALMRMRDRVQGVFADPGGELTDLPPDMLVRPYVPRIDLLSRARAVITRGGHDTVAETLWHGLPLVLAPAGGDQRTVAEQTVAAGAGIQVPSTGPRADGLAEALRTVLDDSGGHRGAAAAIGRTLRAAGGQHAAATHLERLADHATSTLHH